MYTHFRVYEREKAQIAQWKKMGFFFISLVPG